MISLEMDDCIIVWYNETKELVVTTNDYDLNQIIESISMMYDIESYELATSGVCFKLKSDIDTDELSHIFEMIALPFTEKRREIMLIFSTCDNHQRKAIKDDLNRKIPANVGDAEAAERTDVPEDGDNEEGPDAGSEPDGGESRPPDDQPF